MTIHSKELVYIISSDDECLVVCKSWNAANRWINKHLLFNHSQITTSGVHNSQQMTKYIEQLSSFKNIKKLKNKINQLHLKQFPLIIKLNIHIGTKKCQLGQLTAQETACL
jgi:hypothetical protein